MRIVANGVARGATAPVVRTAPHASIVTVRATTNASGAAQNQTAPAAPTAQPADMRSNVESAQLLVANEY